MSPEDVIRFHVQNGYDFLALTDHRIYNYKNHTDEKITILPGMEIDRNFPDKGVHCFHVVSIGPAREDGNGFEQDEAYPSGPMHDQFEFQPVLECSPCSTSGFRGPWSPPTCTGAATA